MVDDLEVREEFGEGNEHQSDHRVIIFKMNLKPATILDNKEYYNKADFLFLYVILLWIMPNIWFAFFPQLAICAAGLSVLSITTPRSFSDSVIVNFAPPIVYSRHGLL